MNRTVLALSTFSMLIVPASADPASALTPELIESLQDNYEMSAEDLARYNAVTNNEINDLALNRKVVAGEDGFFSDKVKTKGITNQKSSGRCWMFAGFNVMRPQIIEEHGLDSFEFSTSYLQFWDKIEKSNLYFEDIIELRNADRLDRDWLLVNSYAVGDGGWWNYVSGLIEKYGVVPVSAMPETHSSENTKTMNVVLGRLLYSRAAQIIKASGEGASIEDLRALKEKSLKEVYRFLAINLGEPPREFEWRYESKSSDEEKESDSAKEKLTEAKTYTPKSFYKEFVGVDLADFVCLYNDPSQEMGAHYRFDRARNIAGQPEMNFVNISSEEMKEIAIKSVKANEAMWFAVNMSIDQSSEHGLMEVDLFDYETLFDLDLSLSKSERSHFAAGASNHAMLLMGVDLKDEKPVKWLVENSWGDAKGQKGKWTLYDSWFDEHVYNIIVNKKHVSAETLAIFEQESKPLPAWYPGAQQVDGK